MAWSPDTSFSSNDGRRKRVTNITLHNKLPSPPQQSDTDGSDGSDENVDENVNEDVAEHDEHDEHDEQVDDPEKAIDRVYQAVWDIFCGLPTEHYPTFQLRGQRSYEKLYRRLQKQHGLLEYFEDHIRVDWDASTGLLTLRLMSGVVYETVQDYIVSAIRDELDRIAEEFPALQEIRNNIITAGHTRVQKRKKGACVPHFSKTPDGQFRYKRERYPPFIIEVAYSQEERSLLSKVTDIFKATRGDVCTVLAIKINYARPNVRKAHGHSHNASVSLWASTQDNEDTITVKNIIAARTFRDADGQAILGDLVLLFTMLLPLRKRSQITASARDAHDAELRISFASLSKSIQIAEEEERVIDASPSPSPSPRPKKLRFLDIDGNVTGETDVGPRPKRQQTRSSSEVFERRIRSASQPRKSNRLRSVSSGKKAY